MTEQDDKMSIEARKLATEIAPECDLWPGIEAAIKEQQVAPSAPRQTPWYAQAAAVFLLVGASSMLTYSVMKYSGSNTPDEPETVVQVVPTNMTFERAAFGGDHTLDSVYDRAAGNVATEAVARHLKAAGYETGLDIALLDQAGRMAQEMRHV